MGNGCLKPTPRNGEIYIDCINKIYDQVKLMQNLQIKNETNLYNEIKDKIQKKGWLRKLMDNLTSHRQSISQAALHNFRLMAQNKGTHYKVTGLIVIDYIISSVLRQSGLDTAQQVGGMVLKMMREKDMNAESQYEESEHKRQSLPTNSKSRSNVLYTAPSLHNIENNEPNNSSHTHHTNVANNMSHLINDPKLTQKNNSLMLREIYNVKFSNIFYNMIQSLISTEDGIYSYGIKSIITYTRYHTVKNIQQQKIQDLLQVLLEHIQTGEQVNLSLKAYEMLIPKLKDSFLQNQIKQFKAFLKIWQESFRQFNDEQNSMFQNNAENRYLIESIIHKMISAMIGSVGINKIYEQIISVYDQHKFEGMIHFEEMLISITKKDELKSQFFRGLCSFLLSYLAVCRGNGMGKSLKNISSVKHIGESTLITRKWPCINSSKSYEAFISDFQNILDLKTKKSVIQTLKRWTQSYRFIEINQIIKYNSSLLLNSFLFNIHECFLNDIVSNSNIKAQQVQSGSKNFARFLSSEFCQNFCQSAEIQQRISLVNQLFDEVKSVEIDDEQKILYLEMINNLTYEQWIESNKIIQFCQVDSDYSKTINLQLISQTNILINKFTQKMVAKQIDQISYFLYSVFDFFSKVSISYQDIISLLNASIKLIQTIQRTQGSLIVLAFTERMSKAVSNEMDKENFFVCWDLILNCTYILFSSPRNYSRQSTKKILNEIYIKTTLNEQLKSSVLKLSDSEFDQRVQKILLDAFGELTETQQEQNLLRIQLPKPEDFEVNHMTTGGSHEKIYELSNIIFREMFSRGVSRAKGGFLHVYEQEVSFQSQTNGFARANSIIREQDLGHQQKSIADVMDMIHF